MKVTIETTGKHFTIAGAFLEHVMKNLLEQPPTPHPSIEGHVRQFTNHTKEGQMTVTVELSAEECLALPEEREMWVRLGAL